MGKATDKQIEWLKKIGVFEPEKMEFDAAKSILDNYFKQDKAGQKAIREGFTGTKTEDKPEVKPKYDNSSYYVSYAKDLFVAMVTAQRLNAATEKQITPIQLMKECVDCIKLARTELS